MGLEPLTGRSKVQEHPEEDRVGTEEEMELEPLMAWF